MCFINVVVFVINIVNVTTIYIKYISAYSKYHHPVDQPRGFQRVQKWDIPIKQANVKSVKSRGLNPSFLNLTHTQNDVVRLGGGGTHTPEMWRW